MTSLSLAIVQLDLVDGAPDRNLDRALELIYRNPGATLYLLPELWTTGYVHGSWSASAGTDTPRILTQLQRTADQSRVGIGGSMISRNAEGALVNRFWLVQPDREPVSYDKAHLFAPMQEDSYLAPGDRRVRAKVGPFQAALSICFDLRFPEQYRLDAVDGTDLFLVVAEWPAARAEALRLFARSRAAENQAYLALCNRVGAGADGTRFGGGSAVIAPNGDVLAEAGDQETVLRFDLDRSRVQAARSALEVLGVRRAGVDH
jgi:predicted amidohydrolase